MACEQQVSNTDNNNTNPNDTTEHATGASLLPEGAIDGFVSIGENKRVVFSQGNLQYQASTDSWRFADEQYTLIGKDNE